MTKTTEAEDGLRARFQVGEMQNAALKVEVAQLKAIIRNLVDEWDDGLDDPFWNAAREALKS